MCLQLFRNKVSLRIVEEFLGLSAKRRDGVGEIEKTFVSIALVCACKAIVLRSLTERGTRAYQKKVWYAYTQGKMLKLAVK